MKSFPTPKLILALVWLLASGCALVSSPPDEPETSADAELWSTDTPLEYWTGLELNGARIGFSHFSIRPESDQLLRIEADLVLAFRSFGVSKKVTLQNRDWVRRDLSLVRFEHSQVIDGNRRHVSGEIAAGQLEAQVRQRGQLARFETEVNDGLRPSSALLLSPFLVGLVPGQQNRFEIFDSELLKVVGVRQTVAAPESSDAFSGLAAPVTTELDGAPGSSWLYADGRPALETSLDGAIVSRLQSEAEAREYLASAVLNKQDVLLDFSRVPVTGKIPDPRELTQLKLRIHGIPEDFPLLPGDGLQHCVASQTSWECEIGNTAPVVAEHMPEDERARLLRASLVAPSDDPRIVTLARQIEAGASDDSQRLEQIVAWLDAHIGKRAVDAFSALDVLNRGQAECQGHSYLFAALARAMHIPTRIVNGLVYMREKGGFLFHTWNESLIDGAWVSIDPTFGQVPADATHVKLVIGENSADLAPMIRLIGRLRAEVLSTDAD